MVLVWPERRATSAIVLLAEEEEVEEGERREGRANVSPYPIFESDVIR